MMNKPFKILLLTSFLIAPILIFIFPNYKALTLSLIEFIAELIILTEIVLFNLIHRKADKFDLDIFFVFFSIVFLLVAEIIFNARLMKIIDYNYDVFGDVLYTCFSIFLLIFIIRKLNIFKRNFSEWGWAFLTALILDMFLSYQFNLIPYSTTVNLGSWKITNIISIIIPYFSTTHTLLWKINSTIYLISTIFIFSLILPFMFRVSDRKTYWFFNFLLLLLIADIAIRYQDNFINTFSFSWAELAWSSAFIGLAWLIYFSRNKSYLFITQPLLITPFVSIRSLLTLSICGTNILFLIGILTTQNYHLNSAMDISRVLFVLFIFWTIANEFSMWLSNDLRHTLENMFKTKQYVSSAGAAYFKVYPVEEKNPIFEISQMLSSYNGLLEQTNKMMDGRIEAEKKKALIDLSAGVAHDIQSSISVMELSIFESKRYLPSEIIADQLAAINNIKNISHNLLNKYRGVEDNDLARPIVIFALIEKVIIQKIHEWKSNPCEISLIADHDSHFLWVSISPSNFTRILSNLLNNSYEALNKTGKINVELKKLNSYLELIITDNGVGISSENISRFLNGVSSKHAGKGIGLSSAKKFSEENRGNLTLISELGKGTQVKLTFPLLTKPDWFPNQIKLKKDCIVIVLDDNSLIHEIWKSKFIKLSIHSEHFFSSNKFLEWYKNNKANNYIFFIDYDLQEDSLNGVDLIKIINPEKRGYLITGYSELISIQNISEELNIWLLPKGCIKDIPIKVC